MPANSYTILLTVEHQWTLASQQHGLRILLRSVIITWVGRDMSIRAVLKEISGIHSYETHLDFILHACQSKEIKAHVN